jgi:hypothetical protein
MNRAVRNRVVRAVVSLAVLGSFWLAAAAPVPKGW